jgi:hypothetical protein
MNFPEISPFTRMRYKRCMLEFRAVNDEGHITWKTKHLFVYLGFNSRDFAEASNLAISTHALQTV